MLLLEIGSRTLSVSLIFPHRPDERGKAFVPGEAIVSNASIRSLSCRCWSSCSLRSSSTAETPPSCRRSHDSLSLSLSRRGSRVEALCCVALRRSFRALPARPPRPTSSPPSPNRKSRLSVSGYLTSPIVPARGERGLSWWPVIVLASRRATPSPSLRIASLSSAIARVLEVREFAAFSLEFVVALVLFAHRL